MYFIKKPGQISRLSSKGQKSISLENMFCKLSWPLFFVQNFYGNCDRIKGNLDLRKDNIEINRINGRDHCRYESYPTKNKKIEQTLVTVMVRIPKELFSSLIFLLLTISTITTPSFMASVTDCFWGKSMHNSIRY